MSSTAIRANIGLNRSTMTDYRFLMRAVMIWGLATLFYFYDNLLQITPSAMKTQLFTAFVNSDTEFGTLSAYCLWGYGLMQIPAGLMVDKYGPRRLLTAAAFFCALGSLLFGWAEGLWLAKFARIWIGVGAAFALVCCLKIASVWFAPRFFALMTGLTVTGGMLGSVCSLGTVGYLVNTYGWREVMQYSGFLGLILAVLLFFWVVDHPESVLKPEKVKVKPKIAKTSRSFTADLWEIMQNRHAWLMAAYAGLMFVPVAAFGGLWGIPFMQEVHGLDVNQAGWSVSLIYLGFMIGSPIYGWLAERLEAKNVLMAFANISTLAVCGVVIYANNLPLEVIRVLFFLIGFLSAGFTLAFAVIQENCPSHLTGTAIGFTNALNTLGAALAQPMIGWALDHSDKQYALALSILPICLVISALTLLATIRVERQNALIS